MSFHCFYSSMNIGIDAVVNFCLGVLGIYSRHSDSDRVHDLTYCSGCSADFTDLLFMVARRKKANIVFCIIL